MTARPERWEKAAERDLARRQRDAGPLFAPLVKPKDPAEIQARAERHAAQIQNWDDPQEDARLEAQAAIDRATVATVVTPEELAHLDKVRVWCPAKAVFSADFWQGECRKRGLPWVRRDAHEAFWAPINAAVEAHWDREATKDRAAGEQLDLPSGYRFERPGEARAFFETGTRETIDAEEEAAEVEATVAVLRAERR